MHPNATIYNSSEMAAECDTVFKAEEYSNTVAAREVYLAEKEKKLRPAIDSLRSKETTETIETVKFSCKALTDLPIMSIQRNVEKTLWHMRLVPPSDSYLFNGHKWIKGVPKFERDINVLFACSTCMQAKLKREAAGQNSTRTAIIYHQGISLDFGFSGTKSKDSDRRKDYVGFNSETCWVLISDHTSGMRRGDCCISKAAPLKWLENFLRTYSPDWQGKYVTMDLGGEMYKNKKLQKFFKRFGYDTRLTGAGASNQNAPVERCHQDLGNRIRSLLFGANLEPKFWSYCSYYLLRIINAMEQKKNGVFEDLSPFLSLKDTRTTLRTLTQETVPDEKNS